MDFKITDVSLDSILGSDILINAITHTEYLRRFATIPHWRGLMPVEWADVILAACVQYYTKFHEAPKKQYILQYLDQNQKAFRFRDDVLPTIVGFLEGLPEERDINPDFEIENTLQFFKRRSLQKTKERLDTALEADDIDLAEKAVKDTRFAEADGVEELDVLDMGDTLQEATSVNEEPLITMGGAFGELVCPHLSRGKFVFFLATAKAGKTWCLYTLASLAYNSGKNVLVFSAGDMDKNDNSIRIGHILSRNDTASDPRHSGEYAYPVIDCIHNQDQTCDKSTNSIKLADHVERMMESYDCPETLLDNVPRGYAPCTKCRTCPRWVPTWAYETHDVQYRGWQGLNTHERLSRLRNGKTKFRVKIYPNNTLTTSEIEKQIEHCVEVEGWEPVLVIIDYADIMAWERGDNERETRHKENTRWKNLRRLSQSKYHPCILTVTQANRAGYDTKSLGATNVNEDRRKLDHATAVFSLNQTDLEKEYRIARVACLMARGKARSASREVVLLQGYESGKFIRNSFWRARPERKKKGQVV